MLDVLYTPHKFDQEFDCCAFILTIRVTYHYHESTHPHVSISVVIEVFTNGETYWLRFLLQCEVIKRLRLISVVFNGANQAGWGFPEAWGRKC